MTIPFRPIARFLTARLRPAPQVDATALQPFLADLAGDGRGILVTINHFSAPAFRVWWIVIIVNAILPFKIRWVVTSGWTNSDWYDGFTHWLFPRGSKILGFTSMPPITPDPSGIEARASAIRDVLSYAKHTPHPVVGLAPEGGDRPGNILGSLPPGSGRFMNFLSHYCPNVLPVGAWEENGIKYLKFGSPYRLEIPEGLSTSECDVWVGNIVMKHIAVLLPESLRGVYQ